MIFESGDKYVNQDALATDQSKSNSFRLSLSM